MGRKLSYIIHLICSVVSPFSWCLYQCALNRSQTHQFHLVYPLLINLTVSNNVKLFMSAGDRAVFANPHNHLCLH